MHLVLGLLLGTSLTCSAAELFDGKWWMKATKPQQEAFVVAYMGCAYFEAGRESLANVSDLSLTPAISTYYQTNPTSHRRPVADILLEVEPSVYHNNTKANPGELERYGFYDGDFWRQMNAAAEREAFLDGYLYCFRRLPVTIPKYSKPTSYYAKEISRWFGVRADDVGEINEKRVNQKIPDVLLMFADKASSGTVKTK